MSKLYELSGAYAEVAARVDAGEDVGDALALLTDQLEHKAAALVRLVRDVELDVDKIDEELRRLTARKKTAVANLERIKRYLKDNMRAAGIERVKAGTFSISVYDGPDRVDITDVDKVPAEYVRTKVEKSVDKAAVLAAYKEAGELVPGTEVAPTVCMRIR